MRLSVRQDQSKLGTRRTIYLSENPNGGDISAFFDFPNEEFPEPDLYDGFVNAFIFHAMRTGEPIRVDGPMSREALLNLATFQEAWACWRPGVYKRVDINPTHIVEKITPSTSKTIVAFSGGVDSIFAAMRHANGSLGNASHKLGSALLVQGFDVPLERDDQFDALVLRQRPLLDELGIRLRTVKTNLKDAAPQAWADSFIAQLSSCLFNFSHEFRYALVGSGEPYNALILPWGQNPCTDHLLSGSGFGVVHEGAAFSRTEKVDKIAKHATATKAVKVCWEGPDASTNCGVCEKCIRTRLNFAAVGCDNPDCFDGPLTRQMIASLAPFNAAQINELQLILNYADDHHVDSEWTKSLRDKVKFLKSGQASRAIMLLKNGRIDQIASKLLRRLNG